MGTILASAILDKVSIALNDVAKTRWTTSELLGWLNDGQRAAAVLKPSCSAVTRSVLLSPSVTKQTIPSDAVAMLEPVRNMGVNGTTPGQSVSSSIRGTLDDVLPNWHTDANAGGTIVHTVGTSDPRTYYVYPKAPATAWYLEAVFSVSPSDVAGAGSPISIDDLYSTALGFYVLHRAYAKNSTDASAAALSIGNYSAFVAALGITPAQAG